MKRLLYLLILQLAGSLAVKGQDAMPYQRHYFSGKDASATVMWDFMVSEGRNSGTWTKIPVPSNWELEGFGTYNYGHDHKNAEKILGKEVGHYKHSFFIPDHWKDKEIFLVFDGVMTDTEVLVNGLQAGEMHQGGFYQFKYDISGKVNFGQQNELEVLVAKHSSNESVNRAERQADFWIFGGIFRPVYLEVYPELYFTGIATDARHDGTFSAHLTTSRLAEKGTVIVTLLDEEKEKIIGKFESKISATESIIEGHFEGIKPWNPETPQLYTALFTLFENGKPIYEKREKVGFRTVELRPNDGIYVNKQRVIFKGVNRHSFYPNTGRALSKENHLEDIRLIKEMNMNAVRMSHYPPDEQFLDLCDSLGLFVLNEITGWQDGYDSIIGPKLIREMILRDGNHPSVVLWNHGNEGGYTLANEKWFHHFDFQKRPVLYPWLRRNHIDTYHYPVFNAGVNRLNNGVDIFMPTEFMHGLYDGGHGAGLEDFWNSFMKSPLAAGGFLWSFADEAVVRTDKNNMLDADGNFGPDGIVGPYRQKEGSFYTVKNIWSPVQIKPVTVNRHFDGKIFLENHYLYTNLNACQFEWKLLSFDGFSAANEVASGVLLPVDIPPGETRGVQLNLPNQFYKADVLRFISYHPDGTEMYTWNWPISMPWEFAENNTSALLKGNTQIKVVEQEGILDVTCGDLSLKFSPEDGVLKEITKNETPLSLKGGPVPVGVASKSIGSSWGIDESGVFFLEVNFDSYPGYLRWKLYPSGLLHLEASPPELDNKEVDYLGISFNYPEDLVRGVKWIGKGPYRVWKNRLKGAEFGLWKNDHNNTITGHSFEDLTYPEFKGYFAGMYALEVLSSESDFKIYTSTPNLYFRLFTPESSPYGTDKVHPPFPKGDISFLHEIPAIGNKFRMPEVMGPTSEKGVIRSRKGEEGHALTLWFDFN